MESLILLIIFGAGVAYFATQNTGTVHILLGSYLMSGIPLYVVVIGSILLGVFVSWLVSMVNTFSVLFDLHGKNAALKKSEKEMKTLEEKNHKLEMEIAHLTGKNVQESGEEIAEGETDGKQPAISHQLSQSVGLSVR